MGAARRLLLGGRAGSYFADVVGLRDHLDNDQLRKNGLRFFPTAGDNADITRRVESGPPVFPPVATWQIDRGLFENELAARARAAGVDVLQGARVGSVELGGDAHVVRFEQFGTDTSTRARWVVDAAGRASLLKRQLGLAEEVSHTINSAWFRLAGGLDFEQWGASNPAWMGRMAEPGMRTFSTNHLLGEGYWIWLIPLSSGPISIGICADPRVHPFEEINELGKLMDWLRAHEPQLAASVAGRLDDVEDFLRVKDFAYGVKQTSSEDRWALVGEAAAFADPYISPGSDMIAFSNTFACDLLTRDLDGEDVTERREYFNAFYQRTFRHVLSRTEDIYPVFGNPYVMAVKFSWDAYIAHCAQVLCFINGKLTDLEFMRSVDDRIDRIYRLNINMHRLFVEWAALGPHPYENEFCKTAFVTPIRENLGIPLQDFDDDGLARRAGQAGARHRGDVGGRVPPGRERARRAARPEPAGGPVRDLPPDRRLGRRGAVQRLRAHARRRPVDRRGRRLAVPGSHAEPGLACLRRSSPPARTCRVRPSRTPTSRRWSARCPTACSPACACSAATGSSIQ